MWRWIILALILQNPDHLVLASVKCGQNESRVAAHYRRGYFRGDGTFVSAANVKEHCRSRSAAYEYWYPKLKNQRPEFWGFPNEKSTDWTAEEWERILEILEVLPPLFRELSPSGIYRMKKSQEPANPASTTFGTVVLYDIAFAKDYKLALVLTHELAHRLYQELSPALQNSFRVAADWRIENGTTVPGRPKKGFLRENGMLSPMEDFSDDIASYLHHPNKLKQVAPKIYRWIDETLGAKLKPEKRR
jgi:hypothetical protein